MQLLSRDLTQSNNTCLEYENETLLLIFALHVNALYDSTDINSFICNGPPMAMVVPAATQGTTSIITLPEKQFSEGKGRD